MSEQSPLRNPLLPVVLLTGMIFGLIYVAVRAADTLPVFQPVPLVTEPTFELSPSATTSPPGTQTPTARPTWTIRPSASPTNTPTPTATATATLYPSLTPAKPLQFNDLYNLREWTPAQANQMVALLQDYPAARFRTDEEKSDPRYNEAYYYPAFAYQEALVRFPKDPSAQEWKWALAYNLARNNAPQAGTTYADLIAQSLQSGETRINNLLTWFEGKESRLNLQVVDVAVPAEYTSSHILQISGQGAAYIWLLGKSTDFETYLLASNFDFAASIKSDLVMGDLTGDGIDEAIISYSQPSTSSLLTTPQIFSLTSTPPTELTFATNPPFDLGTNFQGKWQILSGDEQGRLLQFSTRILPACPVDITRSYRWVESAFRLENTAYSIQPEPSIVEYCEITVEYAAKWWGYATSADFMEVVLPNWPPERKVDGKRYEADARDEWLYRLGIAHALAGNVDLARDFLQEIVESPSIPSGRWTEAAQVFLEIYRTASDLYRACRQSLECDLRAALEKQVSMLSVDRYAFIASDLNAQGVAIRSAGLFDFDRDGQQERWIIVLHQPAQKLELWILARGADGIRALFVDVVDTAEISFRYSGLPVDPPIVQMQLGQGFKLEHLQDTSQPFLTHHSVEFQPTTYTLDTLESAIQALFSGEDPAVVIQTLEDLQGSDRFNCLNFRICDRFYYMLGLAYELNGRDSDAINTYLKLWWEYRDSPFTTMARLKLLPIPRYTPVPTGTPTETPRAYPIPIWTPGAPYPFVTPTYAYPNP